MHILIEKPDTLEYLSPNGKWTKDPIGGKCFPSTRMAFRAAKQEAIGRFSIIRYIPETNQFVNLTHGRGTGAPEMKIWPRNSCFSSSTLRCGMPIFRK